MRSTQRPVRSLSVALLLAASLAVLPACNKPDEAAHAKHDQLLATLNAYNEAVLRPLPATKPTQAGAPGVRASTVKTKDGKEIVVQGKDLSEQAIRQDSIDAIALKLKELMADPTLSAADKRAANVDLSDISTHRARLLNRRAEEDRAALAVSSADIQGKVGHVVALVLAASPNVVGPEQVIELITKGEFGDVKSVGLKDVAEMQQLLNTRLAEAQASLASAQEEKKSSTEMADAAYAESTNLRLKARMALGKEHWELLDRASAEQMKGDLAQSRMLYAAGTEATQQQLVALLTADLNSVAELQQSFQGNVASATADRDARVATANANKEKADAVIAEFHSAVTEYEAQYAKYVQGALVEAAKSEEEALAFLDAAGTVDGGEQHRMVILCEAARTKFLGWVGVQNHLSHYKALQGRLKVMNAADAQVDASLAAAEKEDAPSAIAAAKAISAALAQVKSLVDTTVEEKTRTALQGTIKNLESYLKQLPADASNPSKTPAPPPTPEAATPAESTPPPAAPPSNP